MMISCIVTTYKRDIDILRKAIASIANQTYKNIEIIIVDDNFNGEEISKQIMHLCIEYDAKYIKTNNNEGACAARNLGIKHANGMYIAFLDDDDEWLPNKLQLELDCFSKHSERCGLVFCEGYTKIMSTGEMTRYGSNFVNLTPSFEDMLKQDYVGSTSNPLIRKSVFDKVGGFWVDQPARQDYEMWIRISKENEIVGIEDKLFIHNIHPYDQISKSNIKSHKGYINIYRRYISSYKQYPESEQSILRSIIRTRAHFFPIDCISYCIRWCLLILRYGDNR